MRYLFVGNRKFVLEEMIARNLQIDGVLVIKGSHLENDIKNLNVSYEVIETKQQLLKHIENSTSDILISNGCPFILPVSHLSSKKYINIHPSYLPDLKGIDPVIGAILYQRDAGATCHIMNDEIDSGDIISQIKIPYTDDLDVSLLYQLSFMAEKDAFTKALERNFETSHTQKISDDLIYYSRQPEDRIITFQETDQEIINKTKAFSNKSQGCLFQYQSHDFVTYEASEVFNPYLLEKAQNCKRGEIFLVYEDCMIFKNQGLLKLDKLKGDISLLTIGALLT